MTNNKLPVVGLDQVADPDAYRILALLAACGLTPEDLEGLDLEASEEQDPSEQ
jgi:hypothetical protein